MNASFYNGISGVKTQQFGMDVWANNISNVSTLGFRSATPEFSSLFSASLAGNYFDTTANDIGLGAQSQTTGLNLSQGILENTDRAFDLAISGEGWFGVQAQNGSTYFTRAGQFFIDANGDLVDASGSYLMATSGSNITSTTLDQTKLDQFGKYYNAVTSTTNATPYAISMLGDVPLGTTSTQTKVTLPDLLYFPPEATQNVFYGANLDPSINIGSIQIDLNSSDYPATVTASALNTVDISGTIANTPEILDPQIGDIVLLTLTDANGKKLSLSTPLDASLNWNLANYDVADLDLSQPLSVSAKLQTVQEIANVEHFTTGIISPEGNKNYVDMTFTKVVPQATSGSTWNADVKILQFFEDYVITQYDPTVTYDPAIYDISGGNVKKIYDPSLYKVDTVANKVYEIIDNQTGVLTFGSNGELLSNSIPSLSNGGTALALNLGEIGTFNGLVSSTSLDKANVSSSDGYYEGFLTNYGMDGYGNVIAEFSNGRSSAIAKVALYHFQNDQGLEQISSTYFGTSSNSGDPIFYTNDNGDAFLGSQIYSSKLEGSNVSFATALTELIVTQKAFDANAKCITTSDQLIQNAINMKRA